jgi:hypothetical protein
MGGVFEVHGVSIIAQMARGPVGGASYNRAMALLHQSEIRPSKIELLSAWAPRQPWFAGHSEPLEPLAAYRFDDPEGEVGIETVLVQTADGAVVQVPLTYRGAPLAGGERWLITTMQHSFLGDRWVYDGMGDPAYLAAVANAIRTGGTQAELLIEIDGVMTTREPTARVAGGGTETAAVAPPAVGQISVRDDAGDTVAEAGDIVIRLPRVPSASPDSADDASRILTGTWTGQPEPRVLAYLG